MRKSQASQFTHAKAGRTMAASASRYVSLASADVPELGRDTIDGSLGALRAFLAELAEFSGQAAAPGAEPVLELMIDEIVTVSTVTDGEQPGLCISATLPRAEGAPLQPDARAAARAAAAGCDYLWHAELGCAVLVRRVTLSALRDEPAVMDAIADCAALARAIASAA